MEEVQKPVVAGMFYPANKAELESMLLDFLKGAEIIRKAPKALIVPHAGYVYSGPIAGSGYATLVKARGVVKRVILFGPAHRVYVPGMAFNSANYFETPLGSLAVDSELRERIAQFSFVSEVPEAFASEHSLEVQLPFIQLALGNCQILPILVGGATPEQVAEVIDTLWEDESTLFIVSSDLSHYHTYLDATLIDKSTSQAILRMDYQSIAPEQSCGATAIKGLLIEAKKRSLEPELLDLRNSGDTSGSTDRVVGYGAFSFTE